jgi:ERCC4-type nuclease
MTEIRVDYRESALIKHLQDITTDADLIKLTECNHEIADIHIVGQNVHLVFERKTMSDLAASLKDGRYKEQKHRMLSQFAPKHLTYIIEGATPTSMDDKHGISKTVYDGMCIYTMYRDGIHVVHVPSTADTAKFLWNVATKVQHNPAKFDSNAEEAVDYVSSRKAKSRRIDNMTVETCYIMQLCQVPGVSIKLAKGIQEKYATLRALITALAGSNDPCKELSSIPLIGTKKARTIVEYLLGT